MGIYGHRCHRRKTVHDSMEPTGTVRIRNAAVLSTNLSRFGNLRAIPHKERLATLYGIASGLVSYLWMQTAASGDSSTLRSTGLFRRFPKKEYLNESNRKQSTVSGWRSGVGTQAGGSASCTGTVCNILAGTGRPDLSGSGSGSQSRQTAAGKNGCGRNRYGCGRRQGDQE